MKKRSVLRYLCCAAAVVLLAGAVVKGWGAPSILPFAADEVEYAELYRFDVPAAAEKKTVTEPAQVAWVCSRLSVWAFPWPFEPESYVGGGCASFRFHLTDGLAYEVVYSPPLSLYRTDAGRRWTLTNLEQIWYDCEAPAAPAPESELPVITQ